jgi:signal recognition particle subunit SRP14
VYLSQKRCTSPPPSIPGANTDRHIVVHGEDIDAAVPEATADEPFPDLNPSKPIPILIRATNGKSKEHRDKKIKLSTIVEPDALEAFFVKYAEVCKLGMSGLKKRDRSKAKERLKAKKRKQGGAAVTGDVKKA